MTVNEYSTKTDLIIFININTNNITVKIFIILQKIYIKIHTVLLNFLLIEKSQKYSKVINKILSKSAY